MTKDLMTARFDENDYDSTQVIEEHVSGTLAALQQTHQLAHEVSILADQCIQTLNKGGRIAWCGNGGSAAEAQHLSTELVVRFRRERGALASLALNADGVTLTATGNDYGFEYVFARQVEGLLRESDVLILLTTSGKSPDLLAAAQAARKRNVHTWAWTGPGETLLSREVDHTIAVPASNSAHVQEAHLALGHALCEVIDRYMSK